MSRLLPPTTPFPAAVREEEETPPVMGVVCPGSRLVGPPGPAEEEAKSRGAETADWKVSALSRA